MIARRQRPVVVVPCFNEELRIDEGAFLGLPRSVGVDLLFVDDGSTDGTAGILAHMAEESEHVDVFSLAANSGKAEAVRCGLLMAVRSGAAVTGYYDADLATPPSELRRLLSTLQARPDMAGVLGCRVARLGSSIDRRALRHYLGRAYGTVASLVLGTTVYDSQCGAKLFRVTPTFAATLSEPFHTKWSFDVELLDRLLHGFGGAPPVPASSLLEVPLEAWRDVEGSKLKMGAAVVALADLLAIAHARRAALGTPLPHRQASTTPSVIAPSVRGHALGRSSVPEKLGATPVPHVPSRRTGSELSPKDAHF